MSTALRTGREHVWSNNHDGRGLNWLGMQLMLLRDKLKKQNDWTVRIAQHIHLKTGQPRQADMDWQHTVMTATQTLKSYLKARGAALQA